MFWTADRIYSQGIEQAQKRIYEFFLDIVRQKSPEVVLAEFKHLFINFGDRRNPEILQALDQILTAYNEKEFFYTLRRCCYILINNWSVSSNRIYIQYLIDLFHHPSISKKTNSSKLKTLRIWLQLFIDSEDFQYLKLFTLYLDGDNREERNWSDRFASYLLAYHYTNPTSSLEQRQAANLLAYKMKEKFKFDLAMYTARIGGVDRQHGTINNPTSLSDNVINLVTLLLTKKSVLNCQDLSSQFVKKSSQVLYSDYKIHLLKYLDFSIADAEISETVQNKIYDSLWQLKAERHDFCPNSALILRTSKHLIHDITISDRGHPTELFNILLHHTNPLNLVVLLLKILLINDAIRPYLELKIASIIKYYSRYSESKCKSVIAFIDMLNIALALYAGETRYNIVRMNPYVSDDKNTDDTDSLISQFDMQEYRIFSQAIS
ncbi:hypothetical protein H6F42_09635 [Pseudanabaena sp. FACHB-1998]|uniref:hypothetical protein n=1 Tax=Pseudanabaena sp. FACHB-1998 TaxID=2692858 RepID=UPI0016810DCA|nr:hypothetical protein [Pseudanabaena sp. FACHB-1998]MBD2177170.1 hypothetical protein [Pseudanabaena sp. FACHB-1998]